MDKATVTVQTAPQVVQIGIDQPLQAALANIGLQIGELYGEVRAQRELLAEIVTLMKQEAAFRAQWEQAQLAIAQSLMPDSMYFATPTASDAAAMGSGTSESEALQEGAVIAATAPLLTPAVRQEPPPNATGAAFSGRRPLSAVYKDIADHWFYGEDGTYFIRGGEGQPDRRATAEEVRAIDADIAKGGRQRRRR